MQKYECNIAGIHWKIKQVDKNMKKGKDYRKTKRACYLGFVTQAIVANFTPLLFMAFHHEYTIPIASLSMQYMSAPGQKNLSMKDGMKDRGKCDKIVRHSGCGKICGSKK